MLMILAVICRRMALGFMITSMCSMADHSINRMEELLLQDSLPKLRVADPFPLKI
ncbi:MAG TPA: hypothetical protein VNE41_04140 [Chitinophagaceae bacterium]|nr:hypothetical protein [Chitinophagaceae bacterium]